MKPLATPRIRVRLGRSVRPIAVALVPALGLAAATLLAGPAVSQSAPASTTAADFTPRPNTPAFDLDTPTQRESTAGNTPPRAVLPSPDSPADPNRLLRAPLSEVGRQAIRGGEVQWSVLVVVAGLLLALAGGISLHRRLTQPHATPSPGQTFLAYARGLGLSWTETLLLLRIARAAKLPTPLTLLIAGGPLYHHGRQFAAGLSMARRERVHRTLSAIHRKAFPASA